MGNEAFLVVSYIAGGVVCLCVAIAAWLWLRRPIVQIAGALPRKPLGFLLRKSLPATLMLFALAAFLSVKYTGCDERPYDRIVADRGYMIGKNMEQVSTALSWVVAGVVVWGVIILFSLLAIQREREQAASHNNAAEKPHSVAALPKMSGSRPTRRSNSRPSPEMGR